MNQFLSLERADLIKLILKLRLFAKKSQRLNEGLELIASENVASPAVLAALVAYYLINMQKVTLDVVIMVVVNLMTKLNK